MSISSFLGLQTSLRGLLAHQQALDLTAHNVANASTAGYTRQQAELAAATPLQAPALFQNGTPGLLGQGVDVQSFHRMRDEFADLQFRAQSMSQGQWDATARSLGQAEDALNEPSDSGLNKVLAKFWDAWNDLVNHPEVVTTRQALVNQAQTLSERINQLDGQLRAVGADAQGQAALLTGPNGDVLSAANQIAQLNGAIAQARAQGAQPNDLLDRRDQALDQLSALAQVSVTDLGHGMLSVSFGDAAQPLVDGTTVTWPQALSSPGGKLGALLKLSDPSTGTVAGYVADLDGFAQRLISSVNALHGTPFFSGSSAGTIGVAVAAAGVRASNQVPAPAGANDIAVAIAQLRSGAVDGAYANLVARIGGDARDANQQQANAKALVTAADDRRQSTSGVSMDEEMTSMVRFQRGYQASARAMSTLDEMLDTLINRTGRVGL